MARARSSVCRDDRNPAHRRDWQQRRGLEHLARQWSARPGSSRGELWPRLSMVVWLNESRWRVYWRGLTRTLRRCLRGEELWHGNRETLRQSLFTRNSMLWWILLTDGRRRRETAAWRDSSEYRDLQWVELRSPKDAQAWLERWPER